MEKNLEAGVNRWVDDQVAKLGPGREWHPDVSRALARVNQSRAKRKAKRGRWPWMAAAVAAGASLMAFPAPRAAAQRVWVPCVNACSSLFLKKADVVPATTSMAPDFTAKDANGAILRLSDYKGKVVLLNFWATWCVPCRVEIPWFMEFEKTYKDRGLAVIGVSMDEDGWAAVKPYMDAKKMNYRIALGDEAVAKKYGGLDALPETLLIDREGRVAARHVGVVPKSDYESEIIHVLRKNGGI